VCVVDESLYFLGGHNKVGEMTAMCMQLLDLLSHASLEVRQKIPPALSATARWLLSVASVSCDGTHIDTLDDNAGQEPCGGAAPASSAVRDGIEALKRAAEYLKAIFLLGHKADKTFEALDAVCCPVSAGCT
jgi:hypothetical protein